MGHVTPVLGKIIRLPAWLSKSNQSAKFEIIAQEVLKIYSTVYKNFRGHVT